MLGLGISLTTALARKPQPAAPLSLIAATTVIAPATLIAGI